MATLPTSAKTGSEIPLLGPGAAADALAFVGDAARRVPVTRLSARLPVEHYGAVGDGTTDDTAALAAALAASGHVVLSPGKVYSAVLDVERDDVVIDLAGATLRVPDGSAPLRPAIRITEARRVTVRGGIIDGNRAHNHTSLGTQDGGMHGVAVFGGGDILIEDVAIRDCETDGVYIRHSGVSGVGQIPERVTVRRVTAEGCARQGMSVVAAAVLRVSQSRFALTSGKLPQAGVDLEPNLATDTITDALFEDCVFEGNAGRGFVLDARAPGIDVTLLRCISRGNGAEAYRVTGTHDARALIEDCRAEGALPIVSVGAVGGQGPRAHHVRLVRVTASALLMRDLSSGAHVEIGEGCVLGSLSSTQAPVDANASVLARLTIRRARLVRSGPIVMGLAGHVRARGAVFETATTTSDNVVTAAPAASAVFEGCELIGGRDTLHFAAGVLQTERWRGCTSRGAARFGLAVRRSGVVLDEWTVEGAGSHAIDIEGAVERTRVRGCRVLSGGIGLRIASSASLTSVEDCDLAGAATPISVGTGSFEHVAGTPGLVGVARGTVTISAGQTDAAATWAMIRPPQTVLLTPRAQETVWAHQVTSSGCVVRRAGTTGDLVVSWEAHI